MLAKMHLWLLQAQSTAAEPDRLEETRILLLSPTPRDKRALTPKISAVTEVETGSTAQNLTVKITRYALESIGDGGFKLHKGTKSYSLWS